MWDDIKGAERGYVTRAAAPHSLARRLQGTVRYPRRASRAEVYFDAEHVLGPDMNLQQNEGRRAGQGWGDTVIREAVLGRSAQRTRLRIRPGRPAAPSPAVVFWGFHVLGTPCQGPIQGPAPYREPPKRVKNLIMGAKKRPSRTHRPIVSLPGPSESSRTGRAVAGGRIR